MEKILLLLDHDKIVQEISGLLKGHFVIVKSASDEDLEIAFDLCILDTAVLSRISDNISERKIRDAKIFLPFLLIRGFGKGTYINEYLTGFIDDQITEVSIKSELLTKVSGLIYARNYLYNSYHQTEGKLKISQQLFDLMMEYTPIYVFFKDKNIRSLALSKNYEQMLGMPLDKLLGKSMDELFPSDLAKSMIEVDKKILREGVPIEVEEEFNGRIYSTIKFPIHRKNHPELLAGFTIDITEKKHAERNLIEAEGRLSDIINNTPFGMHFYELERENRLIFRRANKSADNILHINHNQFIGKTIEEAFPPLAETEIPEFYRKVASKGGVYSNEQVEYYEEGGIQGAYSINAFQMLTNQMAVFFTDITERKKAEDALRESEFLLKESQKISHIGSYVLDIPSGTWISSEELNSIFGIGKEYEKNMNGWISLIHTENQEELLNHLLVEVIEQKQPFNREYRIIRKNDLKTRWIHGRGELIYDDKGNAIKMIGTIQDITERKEAEKAIIESEKLYNSLVETAHDLIWRCDAEGRYIYLNKSWENVFGYSLDEMIGRKFTDFTKNGAISNDIIEFERLMNEQGSVYLYELVHIKKDGAPIHLSFNARAVVNKKGEVTGTQGTAQDVTARVQIEEELIRAKEKAIESDRLKSAFLANMSHEIRTPMNGIIGFARLLSEPDLQEDKQQKYIEIINDSCDQLLHVVNDILDISKIEVGQIEITMSETDIDQVLDEILVLFKPYAIRKFLSLNFENTHNNLLLYTDSIRLRQIVGNLISNAIKFTQKGYVKFGYVILGNEVQFFVEDTGVGINKDMFDLIFDRFRQADTSLSKEHGGTGLGLSICKAFVEKLGGKIWLDSQLNKGTTFYFTLPNQTSSD